MKTYTGHKTTPGSAYVVVKEGERSTPLKKHDPQNHSPDGFEWGYLGSGPACLASSLLFDATGCNCQYNEYKRIIISVLDSTWQMTDVSVIKIARNLRRQLGHETTCIRHPLYKEEPKAGDESPF